MKRKGTYDKDPYQVLGVPRNADDGTIRAAYLALVRACHPDRFAGQPQEQEAQERLKEINWAYDTLSMRTRAFGYVNAPTEQEQDEIEALIRNGALQEVLQAIHTIPHSARRCYLSGLLYFRQGDLESAVAQFRRAAALEPKAAYKAALRQAQAVQATETPWWRRWLRAIFRHTA